MKFITFQLSPVSNRSRRTRRKNVSRYIICSEQARRTEESIAYLWSRCSAEDRLSFVFFCLVHTSAHTVLLWSLHLPIILAYRFFVHDQYRTCVSIVPKDFLHTRVTRWNPIFLSFALNALRSCDCKIISVKFCVCGCNQKYNPINVENFYTIYTRFFSLSLTHNYCFAINRIIAMLNIIRLWKISAAKIL